MQGRAIRAVARCIAGESGGRPVMSRISSRSFWDFGNTAVVMNLGTKGEGEASSRRNILIPQSSEAFMAVPDDVLQEHTELFFRRRLGSDDPVQILQAQHLPVRLDQHFPRTGLPCRRSSSSRRRRSFPPFADFLAGGFGEAPFGKDLACCLKDNGPR